MQRIDYIPRQALSDVGSGPSPEADSLAGTMGSYKKGAFQHAGNWYFRNANGLVQYIGKNRPKVKSQIASPTGFKTQGALGLPKKAPQTAKPKPSSPAPSAQPAVDRGAFWGPWAEGFNAAGGNWAPLAGGGWFNRLTGHTWKPGDAIPGVGGSSTDPSMQIYQSLISALTNMMATPQPKV